MHKAKVCVHKAQTALEYLTMVGIGLVILMGLLTFAYFWTSSSREEMSISIASKSVNEIVEAANLVYAQGYPAKTTVTIHIPPNIESSEIQASIVSMRLRVRGGYTDVHATAKGNLTGTLPPTPGYYKLTIQSYGNYVNISRQ